nr:unnamed protein product [Callosobruchus chinensis]
MMQENIILRQENQEPKKENKEIRDRLEEDATKKEREKAKQIRMIAKEETGKGRRADISSDHCLVIAKIKEEWPRNQTKTDSNKIKKYNYTLLENEETKKKIQEQIKIKFQQTEAIDIENTGSTRSFITPAIAEKFFRRSIVKDTFKISSAHGTSIEQYSITIPKYNLKVLINTGSTKSFIHPDIAKKLFPKNIKNDPFQISSAHGTSTEQYIMSSRKRNQVIEEFIEIYRQEPCLWRVKSKEYHDREKRDASYAKLLLKLKELEPDATRKSVVAKINSLRSNVRKEKKKRDMSIKSGASADNVYVIKLWYLDLFDFLGDQDIPNCFVSADVENLQIIYEMGF